MKKNYCIEIDSLTYELSNKTLESAADAHSVTGCKYLVTDFDKSISRVMRVDSDIRYAEAMVVRALQDEGEFDEPVSVITHWKKKRGKTSTDIFFTAVPSRIYLQYIDMINDHDDFLILIPVFAVLANLIEQIADHETIAVVFRHDRFADLVIGSAHHFIYATQCVGFDTSPEQNASLWETVSREISLASKENAVQVNRLISANWIDTTEPVPPLLAREIETLAFNQETIRYQDTRPSVSFTNMLRIFPSMKGIAPHNGKLLHYANKLSPVVLGFFIVTFAIHIFGTISFHSKANDLKNSINTYETRIENLKNTIAPPPESIDYKDALKYVDTLFHNQHMRSYKTVVNDISLGILTPTRIEQLDIEYSAKKIAVSINGIIPANFDTAYKNYQYLLSSLEKSGYTVETNQFDTRIDTSTFALSVLWRLK